MMYPAASDTSFQEIVIVRLEPVATISVGTAGVELGLDARGGGGGETGGWRSCHQ